MQDQKPGAAPPRLLSPGVNAGALRRILVTEISRHNHFILIFLKTGDTVGGPCRSFVSYSSFQVIF